MKNDIEKLVENIKTRKNHVFIVSGNIYDEVDMFSSQFKDISAFLEKLSEKKLPQFIKYDLFSGIQVVRGESQEILEQMNIKQDCKDDKNPDAELIRALRASSMVKTSEFPTRLLDVFQCFDTLLNSSEISTLILIDYSHTIFANDFLGTNQGNDIYSIALTKWSRNQNIKASGHIVILLCRDNSKLSQEIKDRTYDIDHIRTGKPDLVELEEFFKKQEEVKEEPSTLAKLSRGLSFHDLSKLDSITTESISSAKRRVLADEYGDVLEVIDSSFGFDAIGGMKKQIAELQLIAENMRSGNFSAVPQGILLVGPPGTGKTLIAKAVAKEAGVNCVNPGDIKNMFVGKSEERQTRFINALLDLSPVIPFIDEFDQNQAQRGSFDGDSGVSRKIFQKLLTIMSDIGQRGKILWVIACNRPDLVDPAIKRPGRCDVRMPFLPPTVDELGPICQAALVQYPDVKSSINDWSKFTRRCDGYNGSYMVEIVLKAWRHAQRRNFKSIQDEDMEWAVNDFIPPRTDIVEIARMSLLALLECSSQDLMPDNWKEQVQKYTDTLEGRVQLTSKDKERVEVFLMKGSPTLN